MKKKSNFLKILLISFVVAVGIFIKVQPIFAQSSERNLELAKYVSENNLAVGSETTGGYTRVYYEYNGEKIFISPESQNSRMPSSEGQYIAYVTYFYGAGQIFLYNVVTQETTQLTNVGTNLLPQVNKNGHVVWERWVQDRWQVLFYDTRSIKQLTYGDVSINPDIEGDYLTYARQDTDGEWRFVRYNYKTKEQDQTTTSLSGKKPKVRDGFLYLGDDIIMESKEVQALVDNPVPIPVEPETVKDEEISEELNQLNPQFVEETQSTESTESNDSEL